MAYQIEAFIKDGIPTLNIWDHKRKRLCMSWTYNEKTAGKRDCSNSEIQSLFRKLLLLTLENDISNVRLFKVEPYLK